MISNTYQQTTVPIHTLYFLYDIHYISQLIHEEISRLLLPIEKERYYDSIYCILNSKSFYIGDHCEIYNQNLESLIKNLLVSENYERSVETLRNFTLVPFSCNIDSLLSNPKTQNNQPSNAIF